MELAEASTAFYQSRVIFKFMRTLKPAILSIICPFPLIFSSIVKEPASFNLKNKKMTFSYHKLIADYYYLLLLPTHYYYGLMTYVISDVNLLYSGKKYFQICILLTQSEQFLKDRKINVNLLATLEYSNSRLLRIKKYEQKPPRNQK